MTQTLLAAAVLLLSALGHSVASAADDLLTLELSARVDGGQQTVRGQSTLEPATTTPRPLLTARSKTKLRVRWYVLNQEEAGRVTDVTLHFFLDTVGATGQPDVPRPGLDAIYESALVMDLAAKAKGSADFAIEVPAPGNYLLRLETIGAAKTHGHEHFAAMDLKVLP